MKVAFFFSAAILAAQAVASERIPGPFEQQLRDADLVAIVECEVAGAPIARYRVVESWKGPGTGSRVTIFVCVERGNPLIDVTLVGQRYLVIASREGPAFGRDGLESANPAFARRLLGADYGVEDGHADRIGQRSSKEFEARKNDVAGFLGLAPEARELRLLRVLAAEYAKKYDLGARFDAARSVEELARVLVEGPVSGGVERGFDRDERLFSHVGPILRAGGDAATLSLLESKQLGPSKWADQFARSLRTRLNPRASKFPEEPPVPSQEIAELRDWLQGKPVPGRRAEFFALGLEGCSTSEGPWREFLALAREDPAPLGGVLAGWQSGGGPWGRSFWKAERGYGLGTWFGRTCGKDRASNLRKLVGAKDPYVRTAGAIYLCYEDETAGREALRQCLALEGDPGGWAALALARRGEKDAVPRLIRSLAAPGSLGRIWVLRWNLLNDAQALFSNAAAASGLPAPPTLDPWDGLGWGDERSAPFRAACEAWWREHGAKAKLADPWLPLCAEKKVD